jgi:tetratricopeptide (TPR) repeat protein
VGAHGEAAAAYEQLLAARPDWAAGHRHASGSFAAAGQIERAISHGTKASDLDPTSLEFAFHAACLLETVGRPAQAADYLMRAVALDPADADLLRHLSATLFALEQTEQAVALALQAVAVAPADRLNGLHATELLLRTRRYDEAAAITSMSSRPTERIPSHFGCSPQRRCCAAGWRMPWWRSIAPWLSRRRR